MLKIITTALSECTAKQENKASCNTDYIVPDWLTFLEMIENRSKHTLKKEIFTFAKYIVLTKNWFVVSNF